MRYRCVLNADSTRSKLISVVKMWTSVNTYSLVRKAAKEPEPDDACQLDPVFKHNSDGLFLDSSIRPNTSSA